MLVRLQDDPFDIAAALFPEPMPLPQYFQSSHPSSSCEYDAIAKPGLDSSDSRSGIGPIPDNSRIQSLITRWGELGMGQCPLRELSASNDLAVSSWSGDGSIMEHRPLMAPSIPQIKLLGTGVSHEKPPSADYSLQTLSDQARIPSPISSGGFEDNISESFSQADCTSPSEECYALWKKIPTEAIIVTGSNKFVPQTLYKPFTKADKERYLERVSLSAPIIFVTKETLEWGISLENVRGGKAQYLLGRDDPVLQDCGPSVSIRINWPGYPTFKRQISSRNWRKMKGPITRGKLAQYLVKTTGRFIDKMSNRPLEIGADNIWKVGPQHIKVEDLILVSLHHVSKGSWQPQFRLRYNIVG